MKRITAKHFEAATGRKPEQDDLERCNCAEAGNLLHQYCGWDWERNKPNFWPRSINRLVGHSPMKTSVPHVHPVQDLKWRIAVLLERAVEIYATTGDISAMDQATKLARELYESELKNAGNKGTMAWSYINKFGPAIERVEAIVEKRRDRK